MEYKESRPRIKLVYRERQVRELEGKAGRTQTSFLLLATKASWHFQESKGNQYRAFDQATYLYGQLGIKG